MLSRAILYQMASNAYFAHSLSFALVQASSLTLPQLLKPDQNTADGAQMHHAVSSNRGWGNLCPSTADPQQSVLLLGSHLCCPGSPVANLACFVSCSVPSLGAPLAAGSIQEVPSASILCRTRDGAWKGCGAEPGGLLTSASPLPIAPGLPGAALEPGAARGVAAYLCLPCLLGAGKQLPGCALVA